MNKQFLTLIATIFFTGIAGIGMAQQSSENSDAKQLRWGFQLSEGFDGLSQSAVTDFIETNRRSVMLLGAFFEYDKTEFTVNAGYKYVGGELKYKFYRNWAVVAGGSFGEHWLDIERDSYGYYYGYTDGVVGVSQYFLGIGYHNTFWQRLKLQGNAKIGSVHTNKATASGIISSYEYYYDTNKKALKTDVYQLSPSFSYGGNIFLELLPRPWKNRKTPLVPFFDLSVMGNNNSNTKREVTIEEWVPGNIAYHEKSGKMNYDLVNVQLQFGVKWYMKF
ncbi:MAG: hypothetical protein ACK5M7_04820 [Draconibacterium sp.]